MGSMAAASPQTYTPAPLPSTTLDQVAELERRALAAHAAFESDQPGARRRALSARGASPGTPAWSAAQVAIAELESHRGNLMIALADLDRIYVDTSNEGQAIAEIAEARDGIAALLDHENTVISELLRMLP